MKKSLLCCLPVIALFGCQQHSAPPYRNETATAPEAPAPTLAGLPPVAASVARADFHPVAGVQDLMAYEIDPSADALWGAVGIVTDKQGVTDNHPTTEKQWDELRGRAVILIEAANLLIIDGRRVAREGVRALDDQGTPGNYSADQAQQTIDANRGEFIVYAKNLGAIGEQMLTAIDAKDSHALMDAGGALDAVCESCHLKFWYPGQRLPLFPEQAPTIGR